MRWYWIDRFVEFISGQRAVATKNVTLAEDYLHDYFNGHPVFPGSLVLEGLAQTGGMLLGETTDYEARLVLAKVSLIRFHFHARPGDTLTYTATLENVSAQGALIRATSHVDGRLQAEAEYYLAILPERHEAEQLFEPAGFSRLLRLLGVYQVGRTPEGHALKLPRKFHEAESAVCALPEARR